jgi:hypothetical protein
MHGKNVVNCSILGRTYAFTRLSCIHIRDLLVKGKKRKWTGR